jgi:hypothetical protein
MNVSIILLLINLLSTMFMVGLIWFVQVVHYPLFSRVGTAAFVDYQLRHQKQTSLVVAPPMLIEAFSSVLLAWYPPEGIGYGPIFLGVALVFAIWFSTACLQIPCHGALAKSFDPVCHRRLVATNWFRTLAWTARGLLASWMVYVIMST